MAFPDGQKQKELSSGGQNAQGFMTTLHAVVCTHSGLALIIRQPPFHAANA
jgi:hypothetical protein